MFTRVTGTIRGSDGKLAKGAVIEAQMVSQMVYSPGVVGNDAKKTESNSYGRFWLDLAPTTLDATKPDNYYVFKIINSTTNYYFKSVPASVDPVDFDDLPTFVAPDLRPPFLGGIGQNGSGMPITLTGDYTGLFSYLSIKGDGETRIFQAPGKIHLVALNGVVQNPTGDYTIMTTNSIEFVQPPVLNDVILIQYKI